MQSSRPRPHHADAAEARSPRATGLLRGLLGLSLALALTGCTLLPGPDSTPTTAESTTMDPLAPLPDNPTRDQMITQLEASVDSIATLLGGTWAYDGEAGPYTGPTAPENYLDYAADPCGSLMDYDPDKPGHFFHTFIESGPSTDIHADIQALRDWADQHGWTVTNTGRTADPGGTFIALGGPGRTFIAVDVSDRRTMISADTPCSTHPSIQQHLEDQANDPTYDHHYSKDRFD